MLTLEQRHQENLELIVKECIGSIDDGGVRSSRSRSSVGSFMSDYLREDVTGDNHEIPKLSHRRSINSR